jgi:hypothetical protein
MELLSSKFKNCMKELIRKVNNNENFILFATVPSRQLEIVDQLKSHPNAITFTVR